MEDFRRIHQIEEENRELKIQLEEAHDIIHAIRTGEVDALVVNGADGHQLFTLKSADQTYRIFIEQMTESALTIDQHGRILYANSRFALLCGVSLEHVIGMTFLDFVSDHDKQLVTEAMTNAWNVDTRLELSLHNGTNEAIVAQLSLKALKLDDGISLSAIITDLTELKKSQLLIELKNKELEEAKLITLGINENLEELVRNRTIELESTNKQLAAANSFQLEINQQLSEALEQLKESDDRLQSAFNAGDLGSCSLDLNTGKAELSPRFRVLYGLPEVGAIDWEMILTAIEPEYISQVNQVLSDCINFGTPVDSTYPIKQLSTGKRKWMRIVGKVKANSMGVFDSVYAVIMDVTDQKQDEQRKNDFIAIVSHELKTPLTSIKGYIQLLKLKLKVASSDLIAKALDGAERQTQKMASMVDGFLNVARIENGKLQIETSEVILSEIVSDIVNEFKTTRSDIEIHASCQDHLRIAGDAERLANVVSNLINNAIKYSSNSVLIHIECFEQNGNAIFKIEDNGIGIAAHDLPKLFERFYRVESAETPTVSGFGIGLYLCAEIINLHQGTIWAESEKDKGSTFYFSIPLLK